jgi:hypothetical protein
VKEFTSLLLKHREEFKIKNSVWETVNAMMQRDKVDDDALPHIKGLEYLTLDQLGRLAVMLIDQVFPRLPDELVARRTTCAICDMPC